MALSSTEHNGKLLPIRSVAVTTGYSTGHISHLCRTGKIIGQNSQNGWLVDLDSLQDFLGKQSELKKERAQELAQSRAEEYRAHNEPLQQAPHDLTTRLHMVKSNVLSEESEFNQLPVSFRSHLLALSTACAIVLSGAVVARADVLPQIENNIALVGEQVTSGFTESFGTLPSNIVSRFAQVTNDMRAVPSRVALASTHASAELASPLLARPDLSSVRMALGEQEHTRLVAKETSSRLYAPATKITLADVQAVAYSTLALVTSPTEIANTLLHTYLAIGTNAYQSIGAAFDAYRTFIEQSGATVLSLAATSRDHLALLPSFIARMNLAIGMTVINTTHAMVQADVSLAYATAAAAPASARATVALIGGAGDLLAGATSRVPALATAAYLRTTAAPASIAPALSRAVFGGVYVGATHFVAATNAVTARYLAFIESAGSATYTGAVGTRALARATGAFLAHAPIAIEDAYLGALGNVALAFERHPTQNNLAAVGTTLSVGEQAALTVYDTVQGLFTSTTRALATLFGSLPAVTVPTPHLAVVSNAAPVTLPFATSTTPTASRAPRYAALTPQTVNSYPTYTTLVQGVSKEYVSQSLAAERSAILATVAGMIQPVAAQGVTNMNTIQYVNMIQDLSDLIVRNGSFRGGNFDGGTVTNAIAVTATTGTFDDLIAHATTLATTTISGPFTLFGSQTITGSTTITGDVALTGNQTITGTSTASSFIGTSSTATSTLAGSLAVGTSTPFGEGLLTVGTSTPLLYVSSNTGNVGIGTSSPFATFSLVGNSFIQGNQTTTGNGLFGGTLNVVGDSLFSNATTTNFFATTASSTNLFAQSANVGTFAAANSATFGSTLGVTGTSAFTGLSTFQNGFLANASSTITSGLFSMNGGASTTNITASGTGYFGSISINQTTPTYTLDVTGPGHFTSYLDAANFIATSSAATSLFNGALTVNGNSLFSNATTTNFFATTASSTNLFAANAQFGSLGGSSVSALTLNYLPKWNNGTFSNSLIFDNGTSVGIGSSSPATSFAVAGSGYFTGGLGVGVATTTPGVFQTSGNAWIGGNLTVIGNSTTLGASTADSLIINSAIRSHLIPDQNITYDLGSPSYFWRNIYVGNITANTITANGTDIGGTNAATFTINADNATADAENMSLIFFRGNVVPNAVLTWNSAESAKRFEFNQPVYIQNQAASTTIVTLDLKAVAGQTADLFRVASSSGAHLFTIAATGNVGINQTTPSYTLDVTGNAHFTSYLDAANFIATSSAATSLFNGALTVVGNTLFSSATTTNFFATTASSTNLFAQSANVGTFAASGPSTFGSTLGVTGTSAFTGLSTFTNGFLSLASSTITSGLFSMNGGASTTNITASGTGYFGSISINQTTPTYTLDVTGPGHFTSYLDAANFIATSSAATSLFNGALTVVGNSLFSSATTTNFFATTASSTNLFAQSANVGTFAASGLSTLASGFVSQASSTVASDFTTTGTNTFGGLLNLTGLGTFINGFVSQASSTVAGNFTTTGNGLFGGTLNVVGNSLFSNATTTNFFATTASSTNLFASQAQFGSLAVLGNTTYTGTLTQTGLGTFQNGFISQASSTITTGLFSMNGGASTTQFTTTGATYLATLGGNIGIGTTTPASILDIYGTDAVHLPVGTSGQRPSMALTGQVRYNVTTHQFEGYGDNAVWQGLGGVINAAQTSLITAGTDDFLRFVTASGERMTISNIGNVGIGNTTPTYKLDVTGPAHFTSYLDAANFIATSSAATSLFNGALTVVGNSLFSNATTTNFFATTASSTNLFAQSANVGTFAAANSATFGSTLGVTGLSTLASGYLSQASSTVVGNFTTTGNGLFGGTLGVTGNTTLTNATSTNFFATTASSTNLFASQAQFGSLALGTALSSGNGGMGTTTWLTNSIPYFNGTYFTEKNASLKFDGTTFTAANLTSGGNVSLGNATSTNFFATTASSTNLFAQSANVGTFAAANSATFGSTLGVTGTSAFTGLSTFTNGFLANASSTITSGLFSMNGGASTTQLTTTGSTYLATLGGNVGIGTTAPGAPLDVRLADIVTGGDHAVSAFYNTSGTAGVLVGWRADGAVNTGGLVRSVGSLPLYLGTTALPQTMTILNTGNVGVGTTVPGAKLDVVAGNDTSTHDGLYLRNTDKGGTNLKFRNGYGDLASIAGVNVDTGSLADSGYLAFSTAITSALSEKMRITSTGNVGIGTTNPKARLEVQTLSGAVAMPATSGTTQSAGERIRLSDSINGSILEIGSAGGSGNWLQSTDSGNLATNYPLLLNPNGGNVGIGTTTPNTLLTIGPKSNSTSQIQLTSTGGTTGAHFGQFSDATYIFSNYFYNAGHTTDDATKASSGMIIDPASGISFQHAPASATPTRVTDMTILTSGNVGIGTASPANKLEVSGAFGTNSTAIKITNTDAVTNSTARLDFNPTNTLSGSSLSRIEGISLTSGNTGSALAFSTQPQVAQGGALAERMRIDYTGNVGIGTTNPGTKLSLGVTSADLASSKIAVYDNAGADIYGMGLSHKGTNFGLGFYADDTVTANPKMFIDAVNGNVGIGTTNPSDLLQVGNNLSFSSTGVIVFDPGVGNKFIKLNSNQMQFRTSNGFQYLDTNANPLVTIQNGGNVGIGTTNPTQGKLVVSGDSALLASGQQKFYVGDNSNWAYIQNSAASTGTNNLGFYVSGATPDVFIKANGNMGVGTVTPGSKLEVNGDIKITAGSGGRLIFQDGSSMSAATGGGGVGVTSWGDLTYQTGGAINFQTGNGSATTSKMVVTNAGSVGIGTASPGSSLDVVSDSAPQARIMAKTGASASLDFVPLGGTSETYRLLSNNNNGKFALYDVTAGAYRMVVDTAGNVGIGTTNPGDLLTVSGGVIQDLRTQNDSSQRDGLHFYRGTGVGTVASIGTTGDGANGIASLYFSANGTPAMSLLPSGNVGIGTTAPGQMLDVQGNVSLGTPNGATHGLYLGPSGNQASILYNSNGNLDITPRSGYSSIFTAGNVGIGTTTPIALLEVHAASGNAQINVNSGTGNPILAFTGNQSTTYVDSRIGLDTTNNVLKMVYGSAFAASSNGISINSSGNVGIGTMTPSYPLHIVAGAPRMEIQGTTAGSNVGYKLTGNSANGTQRDSGLYFQPGNTTDTTYMSFSADNATTQLVVTSAGNVGIGTTAPGSKLEVNGDIKITAGSGGRLIFQDGSSMSAAAGGAGVGTTSWGDLTYQTGGAINFQTGNGTATTSKMVVTNAGNVGIGVASPGVSLDVSTASALVRITSSTNTNRAAYLAANFGGTLYSGMNDSVGTGLIGTGGIAYAGVVSVSGAYPLQFGTSDTARMTILSGGNVGIGTTGPNYPLEVNGNAELVGTLYTSTTHVLGKTVFMQPGATYGRIGAYDFGGAGAMNLAINSDGGNVGIGTTNPTAPLNIVGSSGNGQILLKSPATSYVAGLGMENSAGQIIAGSAQGDFGIWASTPGKINISANGGGSAQMVLTTGGNVGIGTTAPAYKLSISGTGSVRNEIIGTDAGSTAGLFLRSNGNAGGSTIRDNNKDLEFFTSTTGQVVTIKDNGNMGVGTGTPGSKLEVNGDIKITAGSGGRLIFQDGSSMSSVTGGAGVGTTSWGDLTYTTGGAVNFMTGNGTATSTKLSISNAGVATFTDAANYTLTVGRIPSATGVLLTGTAASALALGANNTEALRITTAGNVGIGTTNPGMRLQVAAASGNSLVSRFTTNDYTSGSAGSDLLIDFGAASGNTYTRLSAMSTGENAWNNLILQSGGGNVGIGTTAPGAKLEVVGTLRVTDPAAATTFLTISGASGNIYMDSNGYAKPIIVNNVMTVDGTNGRVGIGTTAPFTGLTIKSGLGGVNGYGIDYTSGQAASRRWIISNDKYAYGDFIINTETTQGGGTDVSRFYINPAGNVGIGTTAPGAMLDVSNNQNATTAITIENSNAGASANVGTNFTNDLGHGLFAKLESSGYNLGAGFELLAGDSGVFGTGGTNGVRLISSNASAPIIFGTGGYATANERMRITNTGNVGIGTTSPQGLLTVAGGVIRIDSTASFNGALQLDLNSARAGVLGVVAVAGNGISTSAAGDVFFKNQLAGALLFGTNGTEQMRITSTGNVGIGTTTPNHLLTLTNDGANEQLLLEDKNASADQHYWSLASSRGNFAINSVTDALATTTALSIVNSGNVGIGTLTPTSKLEVNGDIKITSGSGGRLIFQDGSSMSAAAGGAGVGTTSWGDLTYATGGIVNFMTGTGTATTSKMVLTNWGNLGLGTTNPSAAAGYTSLTINDALSSGRVVLQNNGTNKSDWYVSGGTAATLRGVGVPLNLTTTGADYMSFATNNSERVRIDSSGNVGIGTTAPGSKLEVNGNIKILAGNSLSLNNGDNGSSAAIYNAISTGTSDIRFRMASTDLVTIQQSGNVGIGTTAPGSKLVVQDSSNREPSLVTGAVSGFLINNAGQEISMGASGVSPYPSFIQARGGGIAYPLTLNPLGGNVGIGTTTPAVALTVVGPIFGDGRIGSYTYPGNAANGKAVFMQVYPAYGRIAAYDYPASAGIPLVLNDTGGNVGIGMTAPGYKLDVESASGNNYIASGRASQSAGQVGLAVLGGTSSTNWLMYMPTSSDDLRFFGNSADRMTLQASTGNVGIGTTAPTAPLYVAGADSGTEQLRLGHSNGASYWALGRDNLSTGDLIFKSGSSEKVRFTAGGNVGIGTTAPDAKLQLVTAGELEVANASGAARYKTALGISSSYGWIDTYHVGTGAVPLSINPNGGNVGIGTTAPAYKLDVRTSATTAGYMGEFVNGSGEGLFIYHSGTSGMSYGLPANTVALAADYQTGSYRPLAFVTNNASRMFIDTSGNVGIGTTAPGRLLTIKNSADAANGIGFQNYTNSVEQAYIRFNQTNDTLDFVNVQNYVTGGITFSTNSTEKMRIQSNGNVGIGTTDPSAAKLVVVGDIRTGTSGTNGCVQNFAGTGLAGTCSSDAALKTVVGNVGNVLDKFAALDLVTYRWNQTAADVYHNSMDALNTGYIAQQVEAQFPELVTIDSKGYRQLNYTVLSLYGMQATKELYAKIQPFVAVLSVVPGVESQCVTGDTRLRRRRKARVAGGDDAEFDEVAIKNIAVGDEIQSLDERTGRVVYARVNALIDMGEQEVYELVTRSGRRIRTTANHPYLARVGATKA